MFAIFYQTHYKTNCLLWLFSHIVNPGINLKGSINKNVQIAKKI